MYSTIKNYEGMVSTLASLNLKTSKIVVSKIVVTGANIDAFMKGFKCAECGGCENLICMAVDLDDANIMAANLKISSLEFQRLYCFYEKRLYMKFPCPFYKDNHCSIYSKPRPKVCRLYPCQSVACKDGNYYIGVKEECKAGVEYLKRFEEEVLSKVPEPLGG